MKILILTARCGMGHYSCASNVEKKLKAEFPGIETHLVDIYEYIFRKYAPLFYRFYDFVVHHGDFFYNLIYRMAVSGGSRQGLSHFLRSTLYRGFPKLIAEEQPDAIISTFSVSSRMASIYKQESGSSIPLYTWITDIEPHAAWVNPGTNLYVVADEVTRKELLRMNVSPLRIKVGGIMVNDAFSHPDPAWKPEKNRLLIMGGGLGLLPDSMRFYDLLERLPNVHTTIVCGSNKKLYKKLRERYKTLTIYAYVDNVSQLMHESSLLLTKPGGVTLFEAIQSGIPLAVFKPKLEQEKYNSHYIENKGIGFVLPGGDFQFSKNISTIERVMSNEWQMETMRRRLQQLNSGIDSDLLCYIFKPQIHHGILQPGGQTWSYGSL